MDADDDLNALLAGDSTDLDSILKDAGLTGGADEIDLDALLADIDAEDSGARVAAAPAHAAAAAARAPAASNGSIDAELAQARGVLSHALAAAAAPDGACDETSVAAELGNGERKPSDMNEDDMLQVCLCSTSSRRMPPLAIHSRPPSTVHSTHPRPPCPLPQAILAEGDDDGDTPLPSGTMSVIDVTKVLAYDSGVGGSSGAAGLVRITSIRDVEADDEKTLRESCNFSMVSPLRAGFVSHDQGSSTSVIQFSHLSGLSSQVTGDKARSLWGLPTCLSVHAKIVACGTSLGCVVLFDHFEGFRCVRVRQLQASQSHSSNQNGSGGDISRRSSRPCHVRVHLSIWRLVARSPRQRPNRRVGRRSRQGRKNPERPHGCSAARVFSR